MRDRLIVAFCSSLSKLVLAVGSGEAGDPDGWKGWAEARSRPESARGRHRQKYYGCVDSELWLCHRKSLRPRLPGVLQDREAQRRESHRPREE